MIRRLSLAVAAAMLAAMPAPAQDSLPASISTTDQDRIDLIERVSRSVAHVRFVPAEPDPARKTKTDEALERLLDRFAEPNRRNRNEEGTGFVLDSARGLILTAAHIVDGQGKTTVRLPDMRWRDAMVVAADSNSGIALLRVAEPLPPALAFSDRSPRAGETALIVGWMLPIGSVMSLDAMVMGEAPAVNDLPGAPLLADYFALDAVLPNGGFGGSPVVDRAGRVVGLVSAILGKTYGPGAVTLALRAIDLRPLAAHLETGAPAPRGEIGVTLNCDTLPCILEEVDAHGPAAAAGLLSGDQILAIDGRELTQELDFRKAVARRPVGSIVNFQARRAAVEFAVRVKTAPAAAD